MKANQNRGAVIFTSIVAGVIIGLLAGVYLYIAWAPADTVLKDAPPKYLRYDPVNLTPQYRDFYIVRAAEMYQRDQQLNITDPLAGAYAVLGVTTGDATIDEALTMVTSAADAAAKENNVDGDSGLFTRNEELALQSLSSALVNAKQGDTYPTVDMTRYAPVIARNTLRLVGLFLLLLLAVVAFLIILMVDRMTSGRVTIPRRYPRTRDELNLGPREGVPQAAPSSSNVTVNVNPTSPGVSRGTTTVVTPSPVVPASVSAATPASEEETHVVTFAPTVYQHGDEHFDEDFSINGPMGEMIGECGASIADRIGVDSPARVSALSLWVFDKNDFQSTTKVLMTDFVWNDPVVRSKLKSRGDAVQAVNGDVVEIQTTMLRVEVQVNDLELNSDNNPPQGYFQKVSLTFKVFKRQAGV